MRRSFRFLWQFTWPNLAAMAGFAAAVTLGAVSTGVPRGESNLFSTYFSTFPMVMLLVLFIISFALCTSNLNLAVSMGARRRDFFWAIQGIIVVYIGEVLILQSILAYLPKAMDWTYSGRMLLLQLGGLNGWRLVLAGLAMLALGCLGGLVFGRSKVWGTIVLTVAILFCMAAMIFLMISVGTDVVISSMDRSSSDFRLSPWGDLPRILTVGMAAVFLVSECCLWRLIRRYCVR